MMKEAKTFRWLIVWITIIAIGIPAALDAHSSSSRVVVGLAEKVFLCSLESNRYFQLSMSL